MHFFEDMVLYMNTLISLLYVFEQQIIIRVNPRK